MNRESERKRLVEILKQNCHCINEDCEKCSSNGICFTRREADHLLDNGIIVPPVKVGQTVYRITKLLSGDKFVTEGIIFEVSSTYENGTSKTRFYFWAKGDEQASRHYSLWCDLTEFEKSIFTSREDALKALEGSGEK